MKILIKISLLIAVTLIAYLSISQAPKYYNAQGQLLTQATTKVDSTYIKNLPKRVTLTNLTKGDLRLFKNLMLQRVASSDKPYDDTTKAAFDKIIIDLNTKADTVTSLQISNLPVYYLQDYSINAVNTYMSFVMNRVQARQFIRIAANVAKFDTAFYFFSSNNLYQLDKVTLKKDLKNKI